MKIRFLAFACHLGISAFLVAITIGTVVTLWYPQPFFYLEDIFSILLMLACIDVILGPLLTLIVYKPSKPSLKFDLAFIAIVQLTALTYGVYSTFMARPVYSVFFGDRFDVICASDYTREDLKNAEKSPFLKYPNNGPVYVGAIMPPNPKEQKRIMSIFGGGMKYELQYYVPYDAIKEDALRNGKRAQDIISYSQADTSHKSSEKRKTKTVSLEQIGAMKSWLSQLNVPIEKIVLLPMKSGQKFAVVALNRDTGAVLASKALDPWWYDRRY